MDIGTGANLVYPIIGTTSYNWSFVASDIDRIAIASAQKTIDINPIIKDKILLRLQPNPKAFFKDIIKEGEKFEITMCNPPFHESLLEAQKGTLRKLSNLKKEKITQSELNFGGQNNELWCKGGEKKFIRGMISESKKFATNCLWFTSLVSKESNLTSIYDALQKVNAVRIETIDMGQGNKKSRLVAWTFLNPEQHKNWKTSI